MSFGDRCPHRLHHLSPHTRTRPDVVVLSRAYHHILGYESLSAPFTLNSRDPSLYR